MKSSRFVALAGALTAGRGIARGQFSDSHRTSTAKRLLIVIGIVASLLVAWTFSPRSLWSPGSALAASTFVVTNTNDAGAGSLRQAIMDANANPGADQITFSIGSGLQTISPTAVLPAISDPVVIDATTQPGYVGNPLIEINGTSIPSSPNTGVLHVTAGNTTIRGFVINRFKDVGISLLNGGGNKIEGNYVGTNAAGNASAVNFGVGNGITINNSTNNTIGGTTLHAGNVISGLTDSFAISVFNNANGNLIQGNLIGLNAAGTAALVNFAGITLGSSNNTVGGTSPSARNVISGCHYNAIAMQTSGTSGNVIQGNYIGTDVTGSVALGTPDGGGIGISNGSNNEIIGGTVPGAGNVISGNGFGISVQGTSGGTPYTTGTVIKGNYIGVAADGFSPLGNRVGISLGGAQNSVIGGTENGAANTIAFNGPTAELGSGRGIGLLAGSGNSIRGNSIYSNGRLGIDLGEDELTANDLGDGDSGPNNRQNFPVITSVTTNGGQTTISGTLNSTANTTFQIDFYSNGACDTSGNGEGAGSFGSVAVITDASGNGTFSAIIPAPLPANKVITATATDPSGNTSEFSTCDVTKAAGAVQLDVTAVNAIEDAGFVTVIVNRTGGSSGNLSVDYATSNITATAGQDYTATSGTLNFANGETVKSFDIPITDDAIAEGPETLLVRLTNPSYVDSLRSPGAQIITILDHGTDLALTVSDLTINEGNSGTSNAIFNVTLSAVTSQTVTVDYRTVANLAASGVDYLPVSGTLTFGPHVTKQTVMVPIIGDTTDEFDENFYLELSNTSAVVFNNLGTATIIDDDPPPTVSISDTTVYEGNSGVSNAVFTVSLSQASGKQLNVTCATANGTAIAGSDYTSGILFLNFFAGETTKTFSVSITGDTQVEPHETFLVNLINPGNVTIARGQATGTIIDDDGTLIQFSQPAYTIGEGSNFVSIDVTRTGNISGPAVVKYTTSDATDVNFICNPNTAGQITGAASRKCDYHIAVGRLRFAAGEASKQIILSIVNDVYVEGPETFTVSLSNPAGGALGSPNPATITIADDDASGQANPIDGTAFYVRMLYVDLLSREPDPAGNAGWIHRIDFCGQPGEPPPPCDRVTVGGDGFLRSAEFFDREFFVIRLYRTALGRILRYDDVGDLAYVSGFLTDADLELNKQELIADLMSRSEFSGMYNSLTNSQYVDTMIQTSAVTIPISTRNSWVSAINGSTKTRAQVFRELSERPEVSAKYLHEAQVVSCYYGFFTRNPDGAYFNFLQRYDNGEITLGDLANAFINAAEYRQRFGP